MRCGQGKNVVLLFVLVRYGGNKQKKAQLLYSVLYSVSGNC